ncbi:MAG TPA: FliH/SctL family protein [Terracidiphilus sp.]|nr:FliH/SctL family protein [Terracidiphilus sp.]
MEQAGAAQKTSEPGRVQLFEYPASPYAPSTPDWLRWADAAKSSLAEERVNERPGTSNEIAANAEYEKRLAEETRRSFEAGCERGQQAEREAQAPAQKAAEERRMRQGAELIGSFAQERDRYMHAVEHEVVKLALAIAARILRREAQMDPLLLTGAVRVALGQLSGSTEVRLRVPVEELALWADAMALLPNLTMKPTVIAGEGMRLGDCVIETSLGSVDLGIRSQLAEIERGFFDRAGAVKSGYATEVDSVANADRESRT